jgi:FtsZ-binding cell division protein ZapB
MSYTLREAAKAPGKSTMTIQRAIKSGRISAKKLEDGSYEIDPAELHRVFDPVSESHGHEANKLQNDTPPGPSLLQLKIDTLVEKIATLEQERERERRDAQTTIDDLRRRLDQEAEERRRLTLMLTDQRPPTPSPPLVEQQSKTKQRPMVRPLFIVLFVIAALLGGAFYFLKNYVW